MAIGPKKVVTHRLLDGIQSGDDPKAPRKGLLDLQDRVMDYRGQSVKRHGLVTLSGTYADEAFMGKLKGKPVLFGKDIRTYDGSSPTNGQFSRVINSSLDDAGFVDVDVTKCAQWDETRAYAAEVAELSDVRAICYQQASYWVITTFNINTGGFIESATHTNMVHLIILNNEIYYFTNDAGGTGKLGYGTINKTTGAIGSLTAMASTTATSGTFDICWIDDAHTDALLIHILGGGGCEVIAFQSDSGPTINTAAVSKTTCTLVGAYQFEDGIGCVVYNDTGVSPKTVEVQGFNNVATSVISADTVYSWAGTETNVGLCGLATDADTSQVYIGMQTASGANPFFTRENSFSNSGGTGGAGTNSLFAWGVRPVAKPYRYDSKSFVPVVRQGANINTDLFGAYLLLDEDSLCIACWLHGYAYWASNYIGNINSRSSTVKELAVPKLHDGSKYYAGVVRVQIDHDPDTVQAVEAHGHLLMGGAMPYSFDGNVNSEATPLYPPYDVSAAATAGGSVDVGLHGYIVVYEMVDLAGYRHRSRASATVEVTVASGNQTITLTIPSLAITRAGSNIPIWAVVYRTEANGSVYFRIGETINDPSSQTITYADTAADSTITDNEELYTAGGRLDADTVPPWRASCVHQHRHFVVDREQESERIVYSLPFVPDEGVEYSAFLEVRCSTAGGQIMALASFIDRLIIFKENRIFAAHGEGKDNTGYGQGYATPYLISEAVGCVNRQCIVETPQGLMFEGSDGIYLLDKSLGVQPIGRDIQWHYDQLTLTRAVLVPDLHYVIFLSSDGEALVYDYLHGFWSTFSGHDAVDAVEASGQLYFRRNSLNKVKTEIRTTNQDDSAAVSSRILTPWYEFAPWQRIRKFILHGENRSHHLLRVKTRLNHEPVVIDNRTWVSGALGYTMETDDFYGSGLAAGAEHCGYLAQFGMSRQKVSAVQLEITDETNSDAYEMLNDDFGDGAKALKEDIVTYGTFTEENDVLKVAVDDGEDISWHAAGGAKKCPIAYADIAIVQKVEVKTKIVGYSSGQYSYFRAGIILWDGDTDRENAYFLEYCHAGGSVYNLTASDFIDDESDTADQSDIATDVNVTPVWLKYTMDIVADTLKVEWSTDDVTYNTTYNGTRDPSGLGTFTPTKVGFFARNISTFPAGWAKFEFIEVTDPDTACTLNEGFSLSAISFEYREKQGLKKLESKRRF